MFRALVLEKEGDAAVAHLRELEDSALPPGPIAGGSVTTASACSAVIKACDAIAAKMINAAVAIAACRKSRLCMGLPRGRAGSRMGVQCHIVSDQCAAPGLEPGSCRGLRPCNPSLGNYRAGGVCHGCRASIDAKRALSAELQSFDPSGLM